MFYRDPMIWTSVCKPNSIHQVTYNVEHKTHMYIVQSFAHTDSHKMKMILNQILSSNTKRLRLLLYLQQSPTYTQSQADIHLNPIPSTWLSKILPCKLFVKGSVRLLADAIFVTVTSPLPSNDRIRWCLCSMCLPFLCALGFFELATTPLLHSIV